MTYAERIRTIVPHVDPRHVEAWMRSEHGTLDSLSSAEFAFEAQIAAQAAVISPDLSEQLAQSFGLRKAGA